MARKSKTATKKTGLRGRPIQHELTGRQEQQILTRLAKGISGNTIAEELGVHPYAVIRVRRGSRA